MFLLVQTENRACVGNPQAWLGKVETCLLCSLLPEEAMLLFISERKEFPVCFSSFLLKIGKKYFLHSHIWGKKGIS